MLLYYTICVISLTYISKSVARKPLVISSKRFVSDHVPPTVHVEIPQRVDECLKTITSVFDSIRYQLPSGETNPSRHQEALDIISKVHDHEYVKNVELMCSKGARFMDPWDSDTYISRSTYDVCLLAQSAWMDAVDEVLFNKTAAFAVTRPPGHHALKDKSMGFCIFNFAVGAANYAIQKGIQRIGIIDFDVHFGNGIASLAAEYPQIRYTSLHELGIFPNEGDPGINGNLKNVLNIGVPYGCKGDAYLSLFEEKAVPFIKEFEPELVIVSAGYDALGLDPLANINLMPTDFGRITSKIRETFGACVFGLEGGYSLEGLPQALKSTILAYCEPV